MILYFHNVEINNNVEIYTYFKAALKVMLQVLCSRYMTCFVYRVKLKKEINF